MAKRKNFDDSAAEQDSSEEDSLQESSSEDDTDMVDVEFEWFDPQPAYDFHGLKTLLRQLFDSDADSFDLSSLSDLILAQPLLGSTVKVEGNETDPYAFLTVLSLKEHKDKPVIQHLTNYILQLAASNPALEPLKDLLGSSSGAHVGLVLTERLINIPSEVVPPMYRMLLEEISWALEEKEPYAFTHYLIMSKTYHEIASRVDLEVNRPKKKKKQKRVVGVGGEQAMFYFHPEDEVLEPHAQLFGSFDYIKQGADGHSDSKRTFQDFGIKPQGHMILIESQKFEAAVKALEDFFGQH
ncbi:MAG: hypothetical protein LQ342_000894 [Letrouitia transgressa]|nr:MAG: hypothetical protein LQ342_000894 [Letrouitia transgressa]